MPADIAKTADAAHSLNEFHIRKITSNFQHADRLLSEIEGVLTASSSKTAFPKYVADLTPAQTRMVENYLALLRSQMLRVLESVGGRVEPPGIGSVHAIRVHLSFVRIAFQETDPGNLKGYGPIPPELLPQLEGLTAELERIVTALDAALTEGPDRDLKARLERLASTSADAESLALLERIIERHGLVELRRPLSALVDRVASPRFEVAFFGQVSSGKSSLLNKVVGKDLLPVGVNPVTAAPTRIVYAQEEGLTVTFADRHVKRFPIEALAEFVSEELNPNNVKGVERMVAGVASERLRDGVVLVDTPGLGSLARAGAAETRAYLPQCDLGVVLVNAASSIGPEDIAVVQSLYEAGVPANVLLSKADLLSERDRQSAVGYIAAKLEAELGVKLPVHAISVVPAERDLLARWLDEDLAPIYERHAALALESVRRKTGVLRESAARALEAKLGRHAGLTAEDRERLEEVDKELRAAAGELPVLLRTAMDVADSIRDLGEEAIEGAAAAVGGAWRTNGDGPVEGLVKDAITRTAAGRVAAIVGGFERVASRLNAVLQATAAALGVEAPPVEAELRVAYRDAPRLDLAAVSFEMGKPWLARVWAGAAKPVLSHKLSKEIGGEVDAALTAYSRSVLSWVRAAAGRLGEVFDSQADRYRAQLTRLLDAEAGVGDRGRMEEDLRALGK